MKLRRALAAAAATAVIGPAALLAAPVAYADGPSTLTSSGGTDSGTTDSTTYGTTSETTTGDSTTGNTTDSGSTTGDTTRTTDSGSTTGETTTGGTDTGGTTGGEKTLSSEWPRACNGEFDRYDKNLAAILTDFPSKITAGSGFHNFTLNVTNNSGTAYERVDMGVYVGTMDANTREDTTGYVTLQFRDPESGMWKNVVLHINGREEDPRAGYATFTGVPPAETFSLDFRISVDAKAPASLGNAIPIAEYVDGEGTCNVDGGKEHYEFEVLAADSNSGKVPDAKTKPGKKTPPAKPSGNTEITPEGQLAETGSSSVLPTIAVIGGVAMAVGAGAVVAVRRRKIADSGTAG